MKSSGLWVGLVSALTVGNVLLGWWAVPVLGAVWGAGAGGRPGTVPLAATAGAAAWALLFLWTAVVGPLDRMAEVLGRIFGVPGPITLLLALAFAALLAGSAAGAAAAVRRSVGRA